MNKRQYQVIIRYACCMIFSIFPLLSHDYIEDLYMPLIKTQSSFDYVIGKYPYVIAYVYTLPKAVSQPLKQVVNGREQFIFSEKYKEIDHVYTTVQHYAEDNARSYSAAGVKCIGINRERGDLRYLEDRYKLDKNASYLLFFQNGKLAVTYLIPHNFSYQTLHAFISQTNIEDFVADELAVQARDAAREEAREERAQKNRRRRYYSSYYNNGPVVGIGYGYPYYGGYWGAPYYGCWGGPYYGPGFGIAVAL